MVRKTTHTESAMNKRLLDYLPEMEFLEPVTLSAEAAQRGYRAHFQRQSRLDQPIEQSINQSINQPIDQQAALAAGLLEVVDDTELEYFLFELVAADGVIAPAAGDALVRVLKRVARPLFPIHDRELASGLGASRTDLKATAARIFGLELEGLSPEDKEFEVARQFIRLAGDVIDNVRSNAGAGGGTGADAVAGNAQAIAERALQQAAQRHAPGLLTMDARGGCWQRQGRRIVVFDC
jgi:methyl-accepting chemotaxis protein